MDTNKDVYSSKEALEKYTSHETLQKGEVSIFERYKSKIGTGRVLDIGIGGGRTTLYLATVSKEYIGVDFSIPFVEYCQAKFSAMPNVTIEYGDARDLNTLEDHSFDFILFSYNGIDYVDMTGREKILSEFSRLLKTDGVLCFSFHNKGNLDKLYSFQFPRNPFKYICEWKRMTNVRKINGDKDIYKHKDWFIIKDGGENFTADTFYIDPIFQQSCLEKVGFRDFSFYEATTGKSININDLKKSDTPWIYIIAHK